MLFALSDTRISNKLSSLRKQTKDSFNKVVEIVFSGEIMEKACYSVHELQSFSAACMNVCVR